MRALLKNSTLLVLAMVMLINALAYGTIIPLLYPYASRFGINPVGLSLLFASFSLAQFFATPVLGRLSDMFGRKPVLLICVLGTSLSLALFASATGVVMLFVARIIDGITGGNISVAQAVIADSTKGEERAKSFAFLGAAFGFGFLIGPTLGGLVSRFGLAAPFWFASALALVAAIVGAITMKETLPKTKRQPSNQPIFRFQSLVNALFSPLTGIILFVGLLATIAQNAFVIGVQSVTNDVLKMDPTQIGLMFGVVGVVNILSQVVGVPLLLKIFRSKNVIATVFLAAAGIALFFLSLQTTIVSFIIALIIFIAVISPVPPLLTGLISERTKGEDQGIVLGINQSYTSLAQIIGPLLAGLVAATSSLSTIFVLSAGFLFAGVVASRWLYKPVHQKFNF